MAKVTITAGQVSRHLSNKGFVLETKHKNRNGEEVTEKWTVWGNQPDIGTILEVEGDLTIKVEEYNGVKYARGHINNPVFRTMPVPGAVPQPVQQAWPGTTIDEDAPF